jgi:hypothetical protein
VFAHACKASKALCRSARTRPERPLAVLIQIVALYQRPEIVARRAKRRAGPTSRVRRTTRSSDSLSLRRAHAARRRLNRYPVASHFPAPSLGALLPSESSTRFHRWGARVLALAAASASRSSGSAESLPPGPGAPGVPRAPKPIAFVAAGLSAHVVRAGRIALLRSFDLHADRPAAMINFQPKDDSFMTRSAASLVDAGCWNENAKAHDHLCAGSCRAVADRV